MKTQVTKRNTAVSRKKNSKKRHLPSNGQQWLIAEIWLKLSVYAILSLASIATIIKLLPYQQVQQEKLAEVSSAAQQAELRVNTLRNEFNRNFDPTQARRIMQEQSPRRDPNQRRIFLTKQ